MKSSNPPFAGHETNDFLQISGTPGGWAKRHKQIGSELETFKIRNASIAHEKKSID